MEKKPLIIIKLMIKNYTNQLLQKLLKTIQDNLSSKYQGIIIDLLNTEKYWKIPELTICYIGVYYGCSISIYDILCCLTTSQFWHKKEKQEEEGVWDFRINGGILLDKNVEWAHVYTWE
ncbi:MAG: hypothetical protein US69_C0010G0043 [candidate division TM6 bacterium GW2011_GWF2_38_10]|nr:MAG: hypothetical protein US69_C0010G0043 [candidate division TM6 bacterium GW2011_GWF2_38_10]